MPDIAAAPRIRIDRLLDEDDRRSTLHDATFWSLRGRPRELPAVWLYDHRGSQLFDEITRLPEYYLTRAEREILVRQADEIAALTEARTLVELGSGTSEKTRLLLDALEAAGTLEQFVPLDVSEEVLRASVEGIAARYRNLGVHALVARLEPKEGTFSNTAAAGIRSLMNVSTGRNRSPVSPSSGLPASDFLARPRVE